MEVKTCCQTHNWNEEWKCVDTAPCLSLSLFQSCCNHFASKCEIQHQWERWWWWWWGWGGTERQGDKNKSGIYAEGTWRFSSQRVFTASWRTWELMFGKLALFAVFPSPPYRSRLIFTAPSLSYVRCKACLVQSHMRKLLISAWNYIIPQPPDTGL